VATRQPAVTELAWPLWLEIVVGWAAFLVVAAVLNRRLWRLVNPPEDPEP
jgi:intracellular septation protein A